MPRKSKAEIERERIKPRDPDDVEADTADDLEEQEKRADEEAVREDDEQSLEGRSR